MRREWHDRDTLLYSLGVGAGIITPASYELEFTTENSKGVSQRVLPTFVSTLSLTPLRDLNLGEIDFTKLVHGEQTVALKGRIPASGAAEIVTTVSGIYDKGSGCLIELENVATNLNDGSEMFSTRTGLFVRGEGGFGGPRGPLNDPESELMARPFPSNNPDAVVTYQTRLDQALLYRLSGDRNPLHSDPIFAQRAGFDRPILHGLCTYGFTGRALLHEVIESDPLRFGSMRCRFSKPVFPGDSLTISMWDVSAQLPGAHRFRTEVEGRTVLDAGLFMAN